MIDLKESIKHKRQALEELRDEATNGQSVVRDVS